MNIIIPMAGNGQRFVDAGYDLPKPMIDVLGKPMILRVLENLDIDGKYHFIVRKEHQEKYQICDLLRSLIPDCEIIQLSELTEGATSSVLKAFTDKIDLEDELIVTNCDQIFIWNKQLFFNVADDSDGTLLCHRYSDSKWSYCIGQVNSSNYMNVSYVVEKPNIIPEYSYANVGLYHWKLTKRFYNDALRMIKEGNKTKNEYYISPLYNYLCDEGKVVKSVLCTEMYGIGTPEDLKNYECKFNLDN